MPCATATLAAHARCRTYGAPLQQCALLCALAPVIMHDMLSRNMRLPTQAVWVRANSQHNISCCPLCRPPVCLTPLRSMRGGSKRPEPTRPAVYVSMQGAVAVASAQQKAAQLVQQASNQHLSSEERQSICAHEYVPAQQKSVRDMQQARTTYLSAKSASASGQELMTELGTKSLLGVSGLRPALLGRQQALAGSFV